MTTDTDPAIGFVMKRRNRNFSVELTNVTRDEALKLLAKRDLLQGWRWGLGPLGTDRQREALLNAITPSIDSLGVSIPPGPPISEKSVVSSALQRILEKAGGNAHAIMADCEAIAAVLAINPPVTSAQSNRIAVPKDATHWEPDANEMNAEPQRSHVQNLLVEELRGTER